MKSTFIVLLLISSVAVTSAQSPRSWGAYAELVSIDKTARTLTLTAMVEPALSAGLNQFKSGEKVVLIWSIDGSKGGDAQTVVLIQTPAQMKIVEEGYITRAEFVSADAAAKTVTFKAVAPDAVLSTVGGAQPGAWVKFTAPMEQPIGGPTVMAATLTEKPAPKVAKVTPQVAAAAGDGEMARRFTPKAPNIVKANGGVSGRWRFVTDLGGTSVTAVCDLAQDGPKLGGTCTAADQVPAPVTGTADGSHIRFTFPSALAATNADIPYDGNVDAESAKITGTTFQSGRSAPFIATRNAK
jgi:hypothetical protein